MAKNVQSNNISNPKRIQGTNDNSILSKCSMIKYGYFDDDYLQYMISKFSRRAPLINRGYYVRTKAIDSILNGFIEKFGNEKFQIISLGAGFDTSFFRLHSKGLLDNCVFLEVDYPAVSTKKALLIKQEANLWNCLKENDNISVNKNEYIIIDCPNYKLIGCDMTQLDVFDACFNQTKISSEIPTLFLSECVITYIGVKKTKKMLNFFSKYFSYNTFVLYEQIYPDDSFGRFMSSHFKSLGASLRGISTYKTKQSQVERFLDSGWDSVQICDMATFYYDLLSNEERQRIEKLEIFDEVEEYILKCCHYFILVAKKDNLDWNPNISPNFTVSNPIVSQTKLNSSVNLIRHNHQSDELIKNGGIKCHYPRLGLVILDDVEYVIRLCGYGQNPLMSGHSKLGSITVYNSSTNKVVHFIPENHELIVDSLCGSVTQLSHNKFLLFAGRSSPINPCNSLIELSIDYNRASNDWSGTCTLIKAQNYEDTPSPRWRHIAAMYHINGSKKLLVYGGKPNCQHHVALSDTTVFDLNVQNWLKIQNQFSIDNSGDSSIAPLHSAVGIPLSVINNRYDCHVNDQQILCKRDPSSSVCCGCCDVIVFGGCQSNGLLPSKQMWRWCGLNNKWSRIQFDDPELVGKLSLTGHMISKSNFVSGVCNGEEVKEATIVLLGGVRYMSDSNSEKDEMITVTLDLLLNIVTKNCTNHININCTSSNFDANNNTNSNQCEMMFNHGSVLSQQKQKIWIIGGGGNCFSFGTYLNDDVYSIDLV